MVKKKKNTTWKGKSQRKIICKQTEGRQDFSSSLPTKVSTLPKFEYSSDFRIPFPAYFLSRGKICDAEFRPIAGCHSISIPAMPCIIVLTQKCPRWPPVHHQVHWSGTSGHSSLAGAWWMYFGYVKGMLTFHVGRAKRCSLISRGGGVPPGPTIHGQHRHSSTN